MTSEITVTSTQSLIAGAVSLAEEAVISSEELWCRTRLSDYSEKPNHLPACALYCRWGFFTGCVQLCLWLCLSLITVSWWLSVAQRLRWRNHQGSWCWETRTPKGLISSSLICWKALQLPWELLYHQQLLWHWPRARARAKCDDLTPLVAGCLSTIRVVCLCFWRICAPLDCAQTHHHIRKHT